MAWIALNMLTGCRGKFLGLVAGVAFASLLIAQQSSIFCGVMLSTVAEVRDVRDAELWVMDGSVERLGLVKSLDDSDVDRVRSVPGVAWAVPYFKGVALAAAEQGIEHEITLHGIDDASLVGAPRELLLGTLDDLRRPDAAIIDEAGYHRLWPGQPVQLGRTIEINESRRLEVVAVCRAAKTFRTLPVVTTRLSRIAAILPQGTRLTSFVLAMPHSGRPAEEVARDIAAATDLQAHTSESFQWHSLRYMLLKTGIPANFAITVALGFLVGVLVAGQTFYLVTLESLPQFGMLKAMGATNRRLVAMVLLQALVVGLVGYGIGVGLAAKFGTVMETRSQLMFYMPWQVLLLTGLGVLAMMTVAALVSIRRVLVLEPGIVFKG